MGEKKSLFSFLPNCVSMPPSSTNSSSLIVTCFSLLACAGLSPLISVSSADWRHLSCAPSAYIWAQFKSISMLNSGWKVWVGCAASPSGGGDGRDGGWDIIVKHGSDPYRLIHRRPLLTTLPTPLHLYWPFITLFSPVALHFHSIFTPTFLFFFPFFFAFVPF